MVTAGGPRVICGALSRGAGGKAYPAVSARIRFDAEGGTGLLGAGAVATRFGGMGEG